MNELSPSDVEMLWTWSLFWVTLFLGCMGIAMLDQYMQRRGK